jgi:hypothetical protein
MKLDGRAAGDGELGLEPPRVAGVHRGSAQAFFGFPNWYHLPVAELLPFTSIHMTMHNGHQLAQWTAVLLGEE